MKAPSSPHLKCGGHCTSTTADANAASFTFSPTPTSGRLLLRVWVQAREFYNTFAPNSHHLEWRRRSNTCSICERRKGRRRDSKLRADRP